MMRPVFDFGKQAMSLLHDVQQNKSDIKALQQADKDIGLELKEGALQI